MEKLKTNELSPGLDRTFRNDLIDNFEKIQDGVDGQSDALNKQITDLLGDVAPQGQNEVTQARIDGNGKLYNTLKGRADATQATAETALLEERATSVEVQDARTNSISQTTYPTLKARMDSQENDLNNSINEKLAAMRLNPEAFANEAALRAKYPQGNDQLNVTTDNGHLWIWIDGGFKDCGQFQTAGIDQTLVDQTKEAFAFANGDNFIANGSFTTGKTEPVFSMNNDTLLAVTDYLGRKWLQITGVGNSSKRGAQWVIEGSDKVSAIQHYPLQLSFDIQSSVSQTFNIDIHFTDNNGQDINNSIISIDQIALNAWQLLNYKKTVDLNISDLAGVAKVVIMIYTNNTGDLGRVLITGLRAKIKYDDNKLPGANLLTSNPLTVNNNSKITDISYLGEVWHELTTKTVGAGQGYQWVIDDANKVSALLSYPLQLSFNLTSLAVNQLFNLDVHFYNKDGNDLGILSIDSIQANAGSLIHYEKQVTFDFKHLQNATKISLLLYSTNADDVGTVLVNHESALLQFVTNQLKGPELIDGQILANNGETAISTAKYLDQEWLKMTSTANTQFRGLQWQIDDPDKVLAMATYPVKFHFNIQSSIAQTLELDIHFYDKNGNGLGKPIVIDRIALNAWELLNYQQEFSLNSDNLKDVTKVVLMLYSPFTNDLGTILINDYSAVLEYNTNEKSNSNPGAPTTSSDYKQLPEVYLDGPTTGMSNINYVKMQFRFKDNGREVDGFTSTKWQGDSSLAFNKKAYRIKTFEDQNLTQAMEFKPCPLWSADNKYNLKAYYTDPLLCRDVVNANIGTDLWATQKNMPDDLAETDDFGFIDGFPVKVFINNEFAGIYSFNTAKGDYGQNAKAVISGETYSDPTAFSALPTGGVKLDGSDFEMISPDNPTDEIKQAVNSLITFVSTSSDEDFETQLGTHIDLESLIDYFIFLNVIENGDAAGKNQTLITWDLQKWYFHPYDLDATYGDDANGNITDPPTRLYGLNSHLFTRLNSLFANEIKSRYKELRTWLTPVYVLKMYRDHINLIGESNYEDEFKLWDNPNNDKNTYNFVKIHVYKRFKLLDSLWLQ